LGQPGEALASRALVERGAQFLARNVRAPCGEFDLVVRQGGVRVLVEVKARTRRPFGLPEESLTATQPAHLIASAQHHLAVKDMLEADWRIDVAAIVLGPGGATTRLEIIENAARGDRMAAASPDA
jgi:putative endonuclease